MRALAFPMRYLRLQTARGSKLWLRDLPGAVIVGLLISLPYLLIAGANYFHKDGFIDKIGTFASVLTGFYVAGLVAVATFPRNPAGLDKVIEVGSIKVPGRGGEEDEFLTRREYVCAMFGYLAFVSLIITTMAIICVTTSDWMNGLKDQAFAFRGRTFALPKEWLRGAAVIMSSLVLGHVFITTVRGLYYLIDRIYAVVPTPLPRKED